MCFSYETFDMNSRFGIGSDFKKETVDISDKIDDNVEEFACDLCDVKAINKEQLQVHLEGKKHKHRLEKKNQLVPNPGLKFIFL